MGTVGWLFVGFIAICLAIVGCAYLIARNPALARELAKLQKRQGRLLTLLLEIRTYSAERSDAVPELQVVQDLIDTKGKQALLEAFEHRKEVTDA